jgi:hypothetical protein
VGLEFGFETGGNDQKNNDFEPSTSWPRGAGAVLNGGNHTAENSRLTETAERMSRVY